LASNPLSGLNHEGAIAAENDMVTWSALQAAVTEASQYDSDLLPAEEIGNADGGIHTINAEQDQRSVVEIVSNMQGENEEENDLVCVEGSSNEEAQVPFCDSIEDHQAPKKNLQCLVEQHSADYGEATVNRIRRIPLQSRLSTSYP
jgi:hypothetical protein